jgi:hypothetical protein
MCILLTVLLHILLPVLSTFLQSDFPRGGVMLLMINQPSTLWLP